jgi:hypothetical protein
MRRVTAACVGVALVGALACGKESAPREGSPRSGEVRGASGGSKAVGKDLTQAAEGEPYVVKLERSACYGVCPVYTVEIDRDGSVRYDGARYVRERGKHASNIPAADADALAARFTKIGFFHLTWKDPCDRVSTDHASATLTYVAGGRKRTVRDYLGDACVPQALRDLEDEVDRVAKTSAWTKCPTRATAAGEMDFCDR